MLDQIAADPIADLHIAVHSALPAGWPSVRDDGPAKWHVFQTREFIESWLPTRGVAFRTQPYFIEVTDRFGGRVMLLPLGITVRLGEKRLSFIDGGLADYSAPILYPNAIVWSAETAAELWARILAVLPPVDLVELKNLPLEIGGQVNPIALLPGQANDESAHGSDLTKPWGDIEASQAQLKTIKRKWRALEKLGAVRFEVAKTPEEVDRFLERALVQKQRRFDETLVRGFDQEPDKRAYFELATRTFHQAGRLQICALTLDGEILATSWNLVQGPRVYEILIGFQGGEWTKFSCGRILNLMMLRWLKDEGFRYLDHGIGDEDWKLQYCDTHVSLRQVIEVRSLRGRLATVRRSIVGRVRATRMWRAIQPLKFALMQRLTRSH